VAVVKIAKRARDVIEVSDPFDSAEISVPQILDFESLGE
jgi:hypothetical protein